MPYRNDSYVNSQTFDEYVWNALGGGIQVYADTLNPRAVNADYGPMGAQSEVGTYSPTPPSGILDTAARKMKAACVEVKPLPDEYNYRKEVYFAVNVIADYNDVNRKKVIGENYNGKGKQAGDPTQNSDDFWKILIVGAFCNDARHFDYKGIALPEGEGSCIFIFNKAIDLWMGTTGLHTNQYQTYDPEEKYVLPPSYPTGSLNVMADYRSRVAFHEILHFFELRDRIAANDPTIQGIMDYFTMSFMPDTSISLTVYQINSIQKQPKPTAPSE